MASDSSLPPLQPGEELYQSPLTVETSLPLDEVFAVIQNVLTALHMRFTYISEKFKYRCSAYFRSGCAQFSIRVWSRKLEGLFAIELLRERGSRTLVSTVFTVLQTSLRAPNAPIDFDEDMFGWKPMPCSKDELFTPPSSDEEVQKSVEIFVGLLTTEYDDVLGRNLEAVAQMCAGPHSRRNFAKSLRLVETVLRVFSKDVSDDTLTKAALLFDQLAQEPAGQRHVLNLDAFRARECKEPFFEHYRASALKHFGM